MSDVERKAKIDAYIDGWMAKLNERAQLYQAEGYSAEAALEQATLDIRREIRAAPPVDL